MESGDKKPLCVDLDGTLVDSNRDIGPAVNHALETIGREPVDDERVRDLIGGGTAMMLERALDITGGPLPETEFGALFATLIAHYEDHIADNTIPYEGCIEALEALADKVRGFDRRSKSGAWAVAALQAIAAQPAVRAGDLAEDASMERKDFKARVRKLKALGLTESLEVGYQLSPRGRAVLHHIER